MPKNKEFKASKAGVLEITFKCDSEEKEKIQYFKFTIEDETKIIGLKPNETKRIVLPLGLQYEITQYSAQEHETDFIIMGAKGSIEPDITKIDIKKARDYAKATKVITGQILWEYECDTTIEIPNPIKVGIKNKKGTLIKCTDVFKDEKERWVFRFEVPKYDDNGKEMHYEVFQETLPRFVTKRSGYNLKNIYYEATSYTIEIDQSETIEGHAFELRLEALNGAPTCESNTLRVEEAERYQFDPIIFTKPGLYKYQIQLLPLFNNQKIYVPIEVEIDVKSVDLKLEISEVQYTHQGRYYSSDCAKIAYTIL